MGLNKPRIVIIGAGPAGIAAGIQLQRYGLEPLLLEREKIGGLLRNANEVENYPGFPHGIVGAKLIALMEKQLKRIGVDVRNEEAIAVDFNGSEITVATNHAAHIADYLVIATGTKSRQLPNVVTAQAKSKVFTEVWPLLGMEGAQILIIGAGDATFDYALNLSKRRNSVTILNRGQSAKCLRLLWERVSVEPAISYRAGVAVRQIDADKTVSRLKVQCEANHSSQEILTDYVIFAIGRDPQLDFLSENIKRCQQNLVKRGQLYFAGDVQNGLFRQTAIAVGDGLRAAMQIHARVERDE